MTIIQPHYRFLERLTIYRMFVRPYKLVRFLTMITIKLTVRSIYESHRYVKGQGHGDLF